MSYEERNAVTGIFVCFVTWAIMLFLIVKKTSAGLFAGDVGIQHWAQTVLWLIAIGIGVCIVLIVLFNIAYAFITGERKPDFLRDERDGIIGLRGIQATLIVLIIGVLAAIIVLALGYPILIGLNILLAGCALSSLAGDVIKLYLYRCGV